MKTAMKTMKNNGTKKRKQNEQTMKIIKPTMTKNEKHNEH